MKYYHGFPLCIMGLLIMMPPYISQYDILIGLGVILMGVYIYTRPMKEDE